jgi:hypothetical protein
MSPALAPLLIAAVWLIVSLLRSHGQMMGPQTARRVGIAALVLAASLLLVRQLPLAVALASAGAAVLLSRSAAARRSADAGRPRPDGGPSSSVETSLLVMTLDPTDGSMDGVVRTGAFAGRSLSDMDRNDLLSFAAEIDPADTASLRLLSGYLDWRFPGWRDETGAAGAGETGRMSRTEALRILGLDDGADAEAIRHAYRRLMKRVHPDQGGSAELAARVRAAHDALLG